MSTHYCSAKAITDLIACQQCGGNQICCKQCFSAKHRKQDNSVHASCKLVDSDLYKNFLKLIHVQWLVGQKLLKSLGGFDVAQTNKQYMVNAAFYGSDFYKEFFQDQTSAQQYLILKCYYSNDPKGFETLSSLQKLLNEAKSLDIIGKYITKLTQPTEQQKIMNSHIDFYMGADIYYLGEFISYEQQMLSDYVLKIQKQTKQFSIYKYIQERQTSKTERNSTYYSNEFTAFLVEFYRKDAGQKSMFAMSDYILNYWQFFNTAVQINPTLKQYLQSEVDFYKQYENLMTENKINVTYLGFKIWKLNNGVSKELPYLKNHYFLFAFVEGYLKMLIERTYSFLTKEEKDQLAKQNWLDFVKFIKDFCLLVQDKNATLSQEEKLGFDFQTYRNYYVYRKRMEPFHDIIKGSKDNTYEKDVAVRFFNTHFESGQKLKPKLYKDFFEKQQTEKRIKQQKLLKQIDELKQDLKQEEKDDFYQFVFINFISYCREQDISIKKETYYAFKKSVFENMDPEYLRLTEEKFKRGDFNETVQEVEEVAEQKPEEQKVTIGQTGAKITVGMDKFEEEILEENIHQDEQLEDEIQDCPCCNGDAYNCKNPECEMMGYCTLCSDS